jgi:hypothetical protein
MQYSMEIFMWESLANAASEEREEEREDNGPKESVPTHPIFHLGRHWCLGLRLIVF